MKKTEELAPKPAKDKPILGKGGCFVRNKDGSVSPEFESGQYVATDKERSKK